MIKTGASAPVSIKNTTIKEDTMEGYIYCTLCTLADNDNRNDLTEISNKSIISASTDTTNEWFVEDLDSQENFYHLYLTGSAGNEGEIIEKLASLSDFSYFHCTDDEQALRKTYYYQKSKKSTKSKVAPFILEIVDPKNPGPIKQLFLDQEGQNDPTYQLSKHLQGKPKTEKIIELLNKGANPNGSVKNFSFLAYTLVFGKLRDAEILIQHGADTNQRSPDKTHPFTNASTISAIRMMLKYSTPTIKNSEAEEIFRHQILGRLDHRAVQLLYKNGFAPQKNYHKELIKSRSFRFHVSNDKPERSFVDLKKMIETLVNIQGIKKFKNKKEFLIEYFRGELEYEKNEIKKYPERIKLYKSIYEKKPSRENQEDISSVERYQRNHKIHIDRLSDFIGFLVDL